MILQNRVQCIKQHKDEISQVLSEAQALLLSFLCITSWLRALAMVQAFAVLSAGFSQCKQTLESVDYSGSLLWSF